MLFTSTAPPTSSAAAPPQTLIRLPLSVAPQYEQRCQVTGAIVAAPHKPLFRNNLWSSVEHERFLHGLEMFPNGPWKEVAKVVGTKTTRQTMTHAQKYRQKIERRLAAQPKKLPKKASQSNEQTPEAQPFVFDDFSFMNTHASSSTAHEQEVMLGSSSLTDANTQALSVSILDQEFSALLNDLAPSLPHDSIDASFSLEVGSFIV